MTFGDNFVFGCATSAFQIEGGIRNDWSTWADAGRLKNPDERPGLAVDHWNRWRDDFALLSELGVDAYRFSIEWARVEPEPGRFNEDARAQYRDMLDDLRARSIEPFVTFHHFTHPPWFHQLCPWHRLETRPWDRFGAFVQACLRIFEDRVRFFTVLNEPNVWLSGSYVSGKIPPGQCSLRGACRAAEALVRAHVAARNAIKEAIRAAQVVIAHNQILIAPAGPGAGDAFVQRYVDRHFNYAFLDALHTGELALGMLPGLRYRAQIDGAEGSLDFIGMNYYFRAFMQLGLQGPQLFVEDRSQQGISELGWEIYPQGFGYFLRRLAHYGRPIYVTENGMSDARDERRPQFLHDHLQEILRARADGVDVRGYFHWSLLDNFEWLEGMEPSFGLYEVDRDSLRRRPRASAQLYRRIIEQRKLGERPEAPAPERPRRRPVG